MRSVALDAQLALDLRRSDAEIALLHAHENADQADVEMGLCQLAHGQRIGPIRDSVIASELGKAREHLSAALDRFRELDPGESLEPRRAVLPPRAAQTGDGPQDGPDVAHGA